MATGSARDTGQHLQPPVWMQRLKAAYDAGHYRTESAAVEQVPVPPLLGTCDGCPFWNIADCRRYAEYRGRRSAPCTSISSSTDSVPAVEQTQGEQKLPWWRRWFK